MLILETTKWIEGERFESRQLTPLGKELKENGITVEQIIADIKEIIDIK